MSTQPNDQKQDKIEAGEIVVRNRFVTWLENYWYHYKLPTIAVLFALFVCIVCFAQCAGRETGDVTVTFGGSYDLVGEEKEAFLEVVNALAPKDEKSGESLSVILTSYSIYTEEELRARFFDEDGNFDEVAYQTAKNFNADHIKSFGTYLMTGESAVLFVNQYIFDYQNMATLAVPLSELYGEAVPSSACNEYAIRLGDTDFYKYYPAVQVLPADTMIVLCKSYVWGASSDEKTYEEFEALFRAIVEFKAP